MRIFKNIFRPELKTAAFILAALLGISLLSSCGQKGPLKLPTALPAPQPPTEKVLTSPTADNAKSKDAK